MYSFVGKMLNVAAFWLKPANLSCMIQSCISVNAGSGIVLQRELTNESRRNQSLVPRVQFWSTRWEFLAFAGLQVMPCMAVVSILQMLPANAISTHAISMSVWVPKGRLPLVPMLIDGIQGPFLGQSVMAVPWQTLHFCLFPLCATSRWYPGCSFGQPDESFWLLQAFRSCHVWQWCLFCRCCLQIPSVHMPSAWVSEFQKAGCHLCQCWLMAFRARF